MFPKPHLYFSVMREARCCCLWEDCYFPLPSAALTFPHSCWEELMCEFFSMTKHPSQRKNRIASDKKVTNCRVITPIMLMIYYLMLSQGQTEVFVR